MDILCAVRSCFWLGAATLAAQALAVEQVGAGRFRTDRGPAEMPDSFTVCARPGRSARHRSGGQVR
jgi:hypothetical protein